MDFYCVMGNPVAHSRSPWIHSRFAELTGEPVRYDRMLVPLEGFAQAIGQLRAHGGRGCNITVPFKQEAAALADQASAAVRLAGAANTLRFDADGIHADNTDGVGLVADITHNAGFSLAGRSVLLIGAGGASAGVLGPLIEAGAVRITVTNRTPEKASILVRRHQDLADQRGAALTACALQDASWREPFDVVINGTASSLSGGAIPVPSQVLQTGTLAVDMMYGPPAQGFLSWAQHHGAIARDGLGMLVEQAAEAFAIWRGVRPPSGQVLRELRALLESAALK